jgi:hypothetical protein|nr:MAG TPA: hypothetical protein [Caudoviricetes sp.]
MIEKNWLTLNEEKNEEIAILLSKVFGKDVEECMCDFQLTFDKFRYEDMEFIRCRVKESRGTRQRTRRVIEN